VQAQHKRRPFQQRPIKHLRFANITAAVARSALENREGPWAQQESFLRDIRHTGAIDGDTIFHPSSKGPDRICMSLRLFTSETGAVVTQNIDVMETKAANIGSHLSLGTPLRIEVFAYHNKAEAEFEDLDELLIRFVEPYIAKFREVMNHKKFLPGQPVRCHLLQQGLGS
jgi:hypothetical protein